MARDILAYRPGVDSAATPLLATVYREISPSVSPDGRWLTYVSDETGRYEVYVRPFPDVGNGRWQVSVDGGRNPQWSSSGEELFFIDSEERMISVGIRDSESFATEEPEVLFESDPSWLSETLTGLVYDVAPDDERFLVGVRVPSAGSNGEGSGLPDVVLVNNFVEIIEERVRGAVID